MDQLATDRNLLFGMIPLQMDFITRDAILPAMRAWVLAKDQSLGQILVERGAMAEDERALLDTLVRLHLERHGGDPQRSLSALSLVGGIKRDLQGIADP